jgi:hypothetical protein
MTNLFCEVGRVVYSEIQIFEKKKESMHHCGSENKWNGKYSTLRKENVCLSTVNVVEEAI